MSKLSRKKSSQRRQRLTPAMMHRLADEFQARFSTDLASSEFSVGDVLPGESELSNGYGVPLSVTRKVCAILRDDGIVDSQRGMGMRLLRKPDVVLNNEVPASMRLGVVAFLETSNPMSQFTLTSEVLRQFEKHGGMTGSTSTLFNLCPGRCVSFDLMEEMDQSGLDGILYIPGYPEHFEEDVRKLNLLKLPIVLVGRKSDSVSSVNFDYESAAYSATELLIREGHTRISFLQQSGDNLWQRQRLNGLKRALKDNDIPFRPELCSFLNRPDENRFLTPEGAVEMVDRLRLESTAVFCSGDAIAAELIVAASEIGVSIPEELSIVGMDDTPSLRYLNITTFQHLHSDLGASGYELLSDLISGAETAPCERVIPASLIIRKTTKTTEHPNQFQRRGIDFRRINSSLDAGARDAAYQTI